MIGRSGRSLWVLGILLVSALLLGGCAKAEKDAGSFADLTPDEPKLKVYHGAQVYLLRKADDHLVVFWGMSPLTRGERNNLRCFIQDRLDRTFRGESRPFVDPCHSAWWASDGRFLGYTDDPGDAPASGPPLVRIPAEVRDDRVILDEPFLRCLQNRQSNCQPTP